MITTKSTLNNENMKTVYCLYRVSTKGQVDKNDIPMQKQSCREFAERQKGWVIKKEFQEKGVSGFKISANDRDAVQELKAAAENHEFDILLVFMFDRLGRIDNETPFVVEWFIQHGIEVWSVNEGEQRLESHVDKLMNYIRFWQANGESEKTSMRVKTRLRQLVEDGIFTGGCAPYGYKLVNSGMKNKKNKELKTLVVDPEEAEIVRLIFEKTVKEGMGSYKMADYLNERNLCTHNGSQFQAITVKRILKNKIYCGYYVRGGVSSEKLEELQIVTEKEYDDAQKILVERRKSFDEKKQIAQKSKSYTMLGGNIYCGHCGKRLCSNSFMDKYTRKDGTVVDGGRRYRYLCTGKAMKRGCCDGQSVYQAQRIDNLVLEALYGAFAKIKATPKDAAIEKNYRKQISVIRGNIKKLEKEMQKLAKKHSDLTLEIPNALAGESVFTPEQLKAAIDIVNKKESENAEKIAGLNDQLNNKEREIKNLDIYYEEFRSWASEFANASLERKRMIICKLFEEILVFKDYKVQIMMAGSYKQFID